MASIAISSATPPNAAQSPAQTRTSQVQPETTVTAEASLRPDTVRLSPAAQAKMMHRAGQSPALIAATLGTNVVAVDGYLNIKVAAQPSVTPAPAPAETDEPAAQPTQKTEAAPAAQAPAPAPAPAATTTTASKD